jgi:hypothetical protein
MPPITKPALRKYGCSILRLGVSSEWCFVAALRSAVAMPANSIAGIVLTRLGTDRRYSAVRMPTHDRRIKPSRSVSFRDQGVQPKRTLRRSAVKNDIACCKSVKLFAPGSEEAHCEHDEGG